MFQSIQQRMFDIFKLLHLNAILLVAGVLGDLVDEVMDEDLERNDLMVAMLLSTERADET
jgi:tRNA A22 N-methylase